MNIGEFEELARAADRIVEGLRLEFVAGRLSAKQPFGAELRLPEPVGTTLGTKSLERWVP